MGTQKKIQSHVAQPKTKLARAASAALILALILGSLGTIPGVVLAAPGDGLQRGIDAGSARYQAQGDDYLTQGIGTGSDRLGVMIAFYRDRGIDLASATSMAKAQVRVGLAKAATGIGSSRYTAMVDFYLARGIDLASAKSMAKAQLLTSGVERGVGADSSRYQALGGDYASMGLAAQVYSYHSTSDRSIRLAGGTALETGAGSFRWGNVTASAAGVQSGIDVDSARYQALGGFYAGRGLAAQAYSYTATSSGTAPAVLVAGGSESDSLLDAIGLAVGSGSETGGGGSRASTDVSKFYVERLRAQIARESVLAANPELLKASGPGLALVMSNVDSLLGRVGIDVGPGGLVTAGFAGFSSCARPESTLTANPELAYAPLAQTC